MKNGAPRTSRNGSDEMIPCPFCGERKFPKLFIEQQVGGLYRSLGLTTQNWVASRSEGERLGGIVVLLRSRVKSLVGKLYRNKKKFDRLEQDVEKIAVEVMEQFLREGY